MVLLGRGNGRGRHTGDADIWVGLGPHVLLGAGSGYPLRLQQRTPRVRLAHLGRVRSGELCHTGFGVRRWITTTDATPKSLTRRRSGGFSGLWDVRLELLGTITKSLAATAGFLRVE